MNNNYLLKANIPSNDSEFNLSARRLDKLVRQEVKLTNCYVCGKDVSSFCNSHTIPKFILKYISINGEVKSFGDLVFSPLDKGFKGIKQAGTFHLICKKCDSILFQKYESEESYLSLDKIKTILGEIALKTTLRTIYKRRHEAGLFDIMGACKSHKQFINQALYGKMLDLKELNDDYKYIKANAKNPNAYKILFYKKLPYRVPIAVQDMINLTCDFNGKTLNNIYNFSETNRLKPFYICVFPFANDSHIIIFTRKTIKIYNDFFHILKHMKLPEQLKIINYMIIDNLDDYFIKPDIDISNLKELASTLPIIVGSSSVDYIDSIKINNKDYFAPEAWNNLTNLLANNFEDINKSENK